MRKSVTVAVSLILAVVITASACFALTPSYTVSESYKAGEYYKKLTDINLTGDYVTDIINVALSQKGYHEGSDENDLSGSGTGYADFCEYCNWYGYSCAWCAVFISWCARQAGIPESIIKTNSWADGKGGRFGEKNVYSFSEHCPEKGDIVYVDNDSDPDADHVGLVYDVDEQFIYTIEGNTSHQVYAIKYYRSTGVQSYYSTTKIVYVGVPDYGKAKKEPEVKEPEAIETPVYEKGDVNADGKVTSLDALLALSCSTGMSKLDSDAELRADVNGDGKVTSSDALVILNISTGIK